MSPHFQTCIYVTDGAVASQALQRSGTSAEEAERLLAAYATEMEVKAKLNKAWTESEGFNEGAVAV